MKNRRVEVKLGKTLNTGDYESLRIDVGYSADVAEGALLDEVYSEAWEYVEGQLSDQIKLMTASFKDNRKRRR